MQLAARDLMKKEYAADIKLSQLSLVDGPPTSGDAPADAGIPTSTGTQGAIDAGKAGADKPPSAPPAEFQARGTATAAAKVEQSAERSAQRAQALREAAAERAQPRYESAGKERVRRHQPGAGLLRQPLVLIAAAVGSLVLVSVLVVMLSPRAPALPSNVSPLAPPASGTGLSTPASATTAVAANTGKPKEIPSEDYPGRVQALESAGNWNVLVIYAAEWTRKQPTNPEAWRELSVGYIKLHQLRDALDAATKAVQVAPEGFLGWQNLGLVNVALRQSTEALVAFEKAVALNDKDVISLVQAGMLNTQLGRLPEARIAFAKALEASPQNVDALCGASTVAQREGRLQDVEAMTTQVKSLNASCPDLNPVQSVRVVPSTPAKAKAEAPAHR